MTIRQTVNKPTNIDSINILHCNVRSAKNKIHEIEASLQDINVDVVCLTEHWLNKEEIDLFSLNDYRVASSSARQLSRGGGTVILVDSVVESQDLDFLSKYNVEKSVELCGILLKEINVFVIVAYRAPTGNFDTFLAAIESVINEVGSDKKIVLAGDFNVLFGTFQRECTYLCDLLEGYGFLPTIFNPTRESSCLDNIFINFYPDSLSAHTIDLNLADHLAQVLKFKDTSKVPIKQEKNAFRPITQLGLNKFFNIVENYSWNFINRSDINVERKFEIFIELLEKAYLQSFPEKTYVVRNDQPHKVRWFNDTLRDMREHLGFLGDLYKQFKIPDYLEEYKKYKAIYKKAIENAKKLANDEMIRSAKNPTKSMWDIINKKRGVRKKENKITDITVQQFNNFFANVAHNIVKDIPKTNVNPVDNLENIDISCGDFTFGEVSFNDVRDVINQLKNKNSRDVYGLSVKMIKFVKNLIIIPLTKLINMCFKESIFPKVLKKAIVTPIFKKGDSSDVTNYRPISLLPIISKIVEKCMANKITKYFEENKLYCDSQFGFRKGRNTVMGILNLLNNIMETYENMEYISVNFYDLSKAFDCVRHDLLLDKLQYYKFHDNSRRLIKSYLEDRYQIVRVDGVSSAEARMNIGVPQGSVLGPILFLIFNNDLPLGERVAQYTLFADDTTISLAGETLQIVQERLGMAQSRAEAWFNSNCLLLNKDKTNILTFSLRNLNNVNEIDHVKFLGVYLDPKLKWDVHIDNVAKRLRTSVFILRNLAASVSQSTIMSAYHSLFHSVMSYGIMAWGGGAQAGRIFGLQRKAIRILAGLHYMEDCRYSFINLKILTFPCNYILENLVYIKNNDNRYKTHKDFHEYDTRNKENLVTMYCRLKRCQNRPDYMAIKLFNKLPTQIKEMQVKKFKETVKCFLIKKAFYNVQEYLNYNFSFTDF